VASASIGRRAIVTRSTISPTVSRTSARSCKDELEVQTVNIVADFTHTGGVSGGATLVVCLPLCALTSASFTSKVSANVAMRRAVRDHHPGNDRHRAAESDPVESQLEETAN
jgi:hypothetical protein